MRRISFSLSSLFRTVRITGILVFLLSTATAYAQKPPAQMNTEPTNVPGEIIIKFKTVQAGGVPAGLSSATLTDMIPLPDTLRQRHQRNGLIKIEKLLITPKSSRLASPSSQERLDQRQQRAPIDGAAKAKELKDGFQRVYKLTFDSRADIKKILDDYRGDPNVEYAEPNRIFYAQWLPNDPYFSSSGSWGQAYKDLWGVWQTSCPDAWDTSKGSGVVVAVVDTGLDFTHPDITLNIWNNTGEIAGNGLDDDGNGYIDDTQGWNFVSGTNNPLDGHGHGTHVAGTIAAVGDNSLGIIGMAPAAKIMALKGLGDNGLGDSTVLAEALIYATDKGADIISNSWGAQGESSLIEDAVNYAHSRGVVVVAAAGNDSSDASFFMPARYTSVIAVSAFDVNDVIAYFSNWGDKIDVAAPGVDVLSLRASGTDFYGDGAHFVGNNYYRASGTSMACPHVAGLAALILSQHPEYSNEQVRQVLRVSADDLPPSGFDLNSGYGRINAKKALDVVEALEAQITEPQGNTVLSGPVSVIGTVKGTGFLHFWLEYASVGSPNWTQINESTVAVDNSVLGTFDPLLLADGDYYIRLRAENTHGIFFMDQKRVTVDFIAISSPVPPHVPCVAETYKPGVTIPIYGKISGRVFQSYAINWAGGIHPTSGWSSTGITLEYHDHQPTGNVLLAHWYTSSITIQQAGYYTLRLTVTYDNTVSVKDTMVYLEPDLMSSAWPKAIDRVTYKNSPLPSIDAERKTRFTFVAPQYVGFGDTAAYLREYPVDGSSPDSTPLPNSFFQGESAVDDYIQSTRTAIITGQADSLMVKSGNSITTLPASIPNLSFAFTNVVVQDVDGQSPSEIIAVGTNRTYCSGDETQYKGYLHCWKRDGQQLTSNFPIQFPDQNTQLSYFSQNRFLVLDLDGDKRNDFLIFEGPSSSSFAVKAYKWDGTPLVWPQHVYEGMPSQMVATDLENDGVMDIVIAYRRPSPSWSRVITVLQPDGTVKNGWPVTLPDDDIQQESYLAIADMDRNGRNEIVIIAGRIIHILKAEGTPFSAYWPKNVGWQSWSPVVGDINGDGYPEILVAQFDLSYYNIADVDNSDDSRARPAATNAVHTLNTTKDGKYKVESTLVQPQTGGEYYDDSKLAVYDRNGVRLKSWNLMGINGNQGDYMTRCVIGDFNQDGKVDIALKYNTTEGGGAGGWLTGGVLTVLSLNAPYDQTHVDWPMRLHDPQNTSIAATSRVVRLIAQGGLPGGKVNVPVELIAHGDENSLTFSLSYDSTILKAPVCTLGSGAGGANLVTDIQTDKIGFQIGLPPGQVFPAGTRQMVVINFTVDSSANAEITNINFVDNPSVRKLANASADTLPVAWMNGAVNVVLGYEGDVAPRSAGNGMLTATDWTQEGRFVAGLDTPAPGSEFQRADCAPKPCGNGVLSATDWTQEGRYVAGLDPFQPVCGTTQNAALKAGEELSKEISVQNSEQNFLDDLMKMERLLSEGTLLLSENVFGRAGSLKPAEDMPAEPIELKRSAEILLITDKVNSAELIYNVMVTSPEAAAVGFSINFDPGLVEYIKTEKGSGLDDVSLIVNDRGRNIGRIGLLISANPGLTLPEETAGLIRIHFRAKAGQCIPADALILGDDPILREVSDPFARPIPLIERDKHFSR